MIKIKEVNSKQYSYFIYGSNQFYRLIKLINKVSLVIISISNSIKQ